MQPSTWNDTNQHWVPQFLLRGFGLKRKASRVYELHKETGEIVVCKVSHVASKPGFLTDRDDELMKDIEGRSNKVIDKIRKGNLRITEPERRDLDQLVAAMMQNDPYSGFDRGQTRAKVIEATSQTVINAFSFWGGEVAPQDMREIIDESLNHDYLTLTHSREDGQILKMLAYMRLTANYHEGEESFVIGDSPLLMVRDSTDGPANLLNLGSQVILPIGSKCVLLYQWTTPINLLDKGDPVDAEQVLSLNRDFYLNSNCRNVYGRTAEALEKSRMMKNKWTPRTRARDVTDGWLLMQSALKLKAAEDQVKDAVVDTGLHLATRQVVERARAQMEADGKPNSM